MTLMKIFLPCSSIKISQHAKETETLDEVYEHVTRFATSIDGGRQI